MSWIAVSPESHFPIQNLPFGIFSTELQPWRRAGVAIGEYVLDLYSLHNAGLFNDLGFNSAVFGEPTLNSFMSLERPQWRAARNRVHDLLSVENIDTRLSENEPLKQSALIPLSLAIMHLPATITDYTDFYSSREHATNVGIMFRGVANALQPNWLHLPVGYHGRASSVVVSGTDIVRPSGQLQADREDPSKGSIYSDCKLMDFELEMAFFVGGKGNPLGRPLTIQEAEDSIFGVVLMNDWSARDVQAWEYVPLGPFTAKNFATSVSPWIVSLDALEPFRCSSSAGPVQENPTPLPYLQDPNYANSSYNIALEVLIQGEGDPSPSRVSLSNLKYMYWNMKQQLVHHSVTGCPMRAGSLLGTGTISGPTPDSFGSMLELSWRGSKEVPMTNASVPGTIRKFLKDQDRVTMVGFGQAEGYRIGFGEVTGKLLPAKSSVPDTTPVNLVPPPPSTASLPHNLRLHSYWRSSSSWRVRLALALKGLEYQYLPVDLLPLVGNTTNTLPADYSSMNPMEQVPTLQFQDSAGREHSLTQSLAIIEFLEESFPSTSDHKSILPRDPLLRARARQIAEIINSGIQPLQNLSVLRQVKSVQLVGSGEGEIVDSRQYSTQNILKGLSSLEKIVSVSAPVDSSLFAAGTEHPSLADICLIPQLYNAQRFGIDLTQFPALVAVSNRCKDIPAFQAAVPEAQPDAVA